MLKQRGEGLNNFERWASVDGASRVLTFEVNGKELTSGHFLVVKGNVVELLLEGRELLFSSMFFFSSKAPSQIARVVVVGGRAGIT